MYFNEEENVQLASYNFKDIAYDWITKWKEGRGENGTSKG